MKEIRAEEGMPKSKRILFLDALRGVAIIAVILFHAYARWPELYPYKDFFVDNAFLNTRIAGVNLFFMISGFVILMTLRKCKNIFQFLKRRWVRLFPAMFLCSLIIFFSATLFSERPAGPIHIGDLLPGLTFLGNDPLSNLLWGYFYDITGIFPHSIEGAFWSLYVEVKFYAIFGILYFYAGENISIAVLFSLFILAKLTFLDISNFHLSNESFVILSIHYIQKILLSCHFDTISAYLYFPGYGFFATGALLFKFYETRKNFFYVLAIAMGIISAYPGKDIRDANCAFVLLMTISVRSSSVQKLLSNKLFIFMGAVSYPLYLLHENMMVSMIVSIGKVIPAMPAYAIPILPMAFVITLAWVVVRYYEKKLRRI
jgi:Predicted acyltransferases